jgi:hypothetical protein
MEAVKIAQEVLKRDLLKKPLTKRELSKLEHHVETLEVLIETTESDYELNMYESELSIICAALERSHRYARFTEMGLKLIIGKKAG